MKLEGAKVAQLGPGQPVFRAVDQRQNIAAEALTDRSVSRIIKSRVRALAILRCKRPQRPARRRTRRWRRRSMTLKRGQ
jgi:hypothetical protein